MSDEEEDYMSDSFLTNSVIEANKSSLISQREKRKLIIEERKKLHDELNRKIHPSIKIIELNNREEGLNKPLEGNNKGFALLQKMGYKPGTGIGKTGGIVEPISVSVKNDRKGLGRENELTRRKKLVKRKPGNNSNAVNVDEYRSRIIQSFHDREVEKYFRISQRVCQQLDMKQGYSKPLFDWYWPDVSSEPLSPCNDKDSDDDDGYIGDGSSDYEDKTDGEEVETDGEEVETDSEEESANDAPSNDLEDNADDNIDDVEKLRLLTCYLRETYFYCIWCGVAYEDETDLTSSCPGNTKISHDD